MSTRPMVSYDDITLPYGQTNERSKPSASSSLTEPPLKRRKNSNWSNNHRNVHESQGSISQKQPMNTASGSNKSHQLQEEESYDENVVVGEGEYEEEESRELTHEEIWDDSALTYAWEAAMEEYEAYHGPEKDWKREPVKKSPLWYNIPVDPSRRSTNASSKFKALANNTKPEITADEDAEPDSKLIDFDTFVPNHDPSLEPSVTPAATATVLNANYIADTPAGPIVSQDEAFQRALNAMYWGGYWTAMYHTQRQLSQSQNRSTAQGFAVTGDNDTKDEETPTKEVEEIEVDEDSDFISTQR